MKRALKRLLKTCFRLFPLEFYFTAGGFIFAAGTAQFAQGFKVAHGGRSFAQFQSVAYKEIHETLEEFLGIFLEGDQFFFAGGLVGFFKQFLDILLKGFKLLVGDSVFLAVFTAKLRVNKVIQKIRLAQVAAVFINPPYQLRRYNQHSFVRHGISFYCPSKLGFVLFIIFKVQCV